MMGNEQVRIQRKRLVDHTFGHIDAQQYARHPGFVITDILSAVIVLFLQRQRSERFDRRSDIFHFYRHSILD